MRILRVLVLLAPLLASCAGPSLTSRHRDQEDAWRRAAPMPAAGPDDPLAGQPQLERNALVSAVLARNPSIAAARWAWRAALARYPQETALEDPMLEYTLAPASIGSSSVDTGQAVALSQAFPFPGKLALRGEIALAEAEAAAGDHEAVRLRLALVASLLYDQAFLVERKLAVNDAHRTLLQELREIAVARYEAGTANQQDPLEAELEESALLHRDVVLRAERRIVAEQLNVLLHRSSGLALPPLPALLIDDGAEPAPREALLSRALAERPELRAADARVRAREAARDLARREYLPDFRLMGGYDAIMQEEDLQPRVGLALNLPLQRGRRAAALDEAEARLERARSLRAGVDDEVRFAVEQALERLHEARHGLEIVRDRVVPAANDRVVSARAAFETGQADFSTLIDAERDLRDAELSHAEALVEVSRRRAELARAIGMLPEGAMR